jgi:hypothetical protein
MQINDLRQIIFVVKTNLRLDIREVFKAPIALSTPYRVLACLLCRAATLWALNFLIVRWFEANHFDLLSSMSILV